MQKVSVERMRKDPTVNLALDTINQNRQALIFVSSKVSAEKVALDIAKARKDTNDEELQKKTLNVLSQPTVQCERLATCMQKKVAFHHAGLPAGQKHLIEENFRQSNINIIVCTPTLAAGVDLPAYRAIIRDTKRFSAGWGMQHIPVIEYHQMAGRAGRPGKETHGEAILIAQNYSDIDVYKEKFIDGEPENITSKLAVEPVLRKHTLSLISSGMIQDYDGLLDFFKNTFYAHQFGDFGHLKQIVQRVLGLLRQWNMIESQEQAFTSAADLASPKLKATPLGYKVSQLYIDPLSAKTLLDGIQQAKPSETDTTSLQFALLHLCATTNEARPLFNVGKGETEAIIAVSAQFEESLLLPLPSIYEIEYKQFIQALKTSLVLHNWINEMPERDLLAKFNVRPGELKGKIDALSWLVRATHQLAAISNKQDITTILAKLEQRLLHGVSERLLPLIALKDIGRVRAQKLYAAGLTSPAKVFTAPPEKLEGLLGKALAKKLQERAQHYNR